MLNEFSRTELLIGKDALNKLKRSSVAVFGIGGVGSFTVEALVRSGVGKIILIDDDCVCLTNINRQLHATQKTIGMPKVLAMKNRINEISKETEVVTHQRFYMPGCSKELLSKDYNYIVDAVDTVTAKIDLVVSSKELNIPIISCMGAGNKLNPTGFKVSDIYSTSVCPLARVMRKELKRRKVDSLKVVYSEEEPRKHSDAEISSCNIGCVCPVGTTRKCTDKHHIPGSISFVPSVAGLIIAAEVVKDLVSKNQHETI